MFDSPSEAPAVLNRVRVRIRNRYYFGVHVPKTTGTVILDGSGRKIVQVEAKELSFP